MGVQILIDFALNVMQNCSTFIIALLFGLYYEKIKHWLGLHWNKKNKQWLIFVQKSYFTSEKPDIFIGENIDTLNGF